MPATEVLCLSFRRLSEALPARWAKIRWLPTWANGSRMRHLATSTCPRKHAASNAKLQSTELESSDTIRDGDGSAPSVTLDTYSHLWPNAADRTRAAAQGLAEQIFGACGRPADGSRKSPC